MISGGNQLKYQYSTYIPSAGAPAHPGRSKSLVCSILAVPPSVPCYSSYDDVLLRLEPYAVDRRCLVAGISGHTCYAGHV